MNHLIPLIVILLLASCRTTVETVVKGFALTGADGWDYLK